MFQLSGVHCSSFLGSLREAGEVPWGAQGKPKGLLGYILRLMDKILHYLKDPKLWELRYIPYYGSCRILSINRSTPLEPPALKDLMKVLGWGSHVCFEFLALLDSSDR